MVGARFWWFSDGWAKKTQDLVDWGTMQDMRDATSLVSAFEMTWQMRISRPSRWTAADLERLFPPPVSVAEKASAHT